MTAVPGLFSGYFPRVVDMSEKAHEPAWRPDILGPGFQAREFRLGPDPEGEGEAVATLVRHLPDPDDPPAGWSRRPAVLWVHGMTDYFFHTHVAQFLHGHGYAFYALDLRKCGRSCREDQCWHYSENLQHYYPDLAAATGHLAAHHPGIIPLAHSTGGLIVALWLDHLRRARSPRHAAIDGLILNSPWLDMMYPPALVRTLRPVAHLAGRRWPRLQVPGGGLGVYGKSLHRDHHGDWDFDLRMKPVGGHRKYLGWLRTVLIGQGQVHAGQVDVGVPVLTLLSSRSLLGQPYSEDSATADMVLDVEQIRRWAPTLAEQVTVHPIEDARHDVFLSRTPAREEALAVTAAWLGGLSHAGEAEAGPAGSATGDR